MRKAWIGLWLVGAGPLLALTDAELKTVLDGYGARRDRVLQRQVASPYPGAQPDSDVQLQAWNKLDYALSALYLNTEVDKANQAVRDICALDLSAPIGNGETRFHWLAPLLIRVHELFWSGSAHFPGRLADDAAAAIRATLWRWAATEGKLVDTRLDRLWWFWGSENHDAMHDGAVWGAARLLARDPAYAGQKYADGSTPVEQDKAWTAFLAEQLAERVRRGLCVEIASDGYSKYTLQNWYNFFDFADEPLRSAAEAALHVWWADWATEQLDGVRGGGKARCYQESNRLAINDNSRAMAWFYLGIGQAANAHPGLMCLITSGYRMPAEIAALALDPAGRGRYESISRRPGLLQSPAPAGIAADTYAVDPESPGILRYTWVTPEVILGSLITARRSAGDWTAISSQNRWQGAIFGGHPDARIFAECEGLNNGKTYNQHVAVQKRGTQLVAKLPAPYGKQTGRLRVWVAPMLTRSTAGDWQIVEAPQAWAAVRPAWGGAAWEENWLVFADDRAAMILEVAPKQDYGDREAWAAAVQARSLTVADGLVSYDGLGGTLTLDTAGDAPPTVDGAPVDLAPTKTFDSPWLREDWGSGQVIIGQGERVLRVTAP